MNIDLLKTLISTQSLSGNEAEIASFIQQTLHKMGVQTFLYKGNCIGYIPGKDQKKAIILNGHIDTVSPGNKNEWQTPPFSKNVRIKGDKIFGLGVSDMKCGVFAFLEVAAQFGVQKPPVDIFLSFVIQEEVDGSGTKDFATWFKKNHIATYKHVAGIIGEPTGLSYIGIGNKGNYFLNVKVAGDTGHSSTPDHISHNAVGEMFSIFETLQGVEKKWQQTYSDAVLGVPTIGYFTSIAAGNAEVPNMFPSKCTATFDIRTTPNMHNLVLDQITEALLKFDVILSPVYPPAAGAYTNPGGTVPTILKKISGAPFQAFPGSTDQYFLTEIGVETVVFGPGEPSAMHTTNEWCSLSKIEKSIELYKEFIYSYAKRDP